MGIITPHLFSTSIGNQTHLESSHVPRVAGVLQTVLIALQKELQKKSGTNRQDVYKWCTSEKDSDRFCGVARVGRVEIRTVICPGEGAKLRKVDERNGMTLQLVPMKDFCANVLFIPEHCPVPSNDVKLFVLFVYKYSLNMKMMVKVYSLSGV